MPTSRSLRKIGTRKCARKLTLTAKIYQWFSIETEYYTALHRKTQLTDDKKRFNTHLGSLRQDNHGTDREIARLKKFSKADQNHKIQDEEHKKNTDDIIKQN